MPLAREGSAAFFLLIFRNNYAALVQYIKKMRNFAKHNELHCAKELK